jgi:putative transposase
MPVVQAYRFAPDPTPAQGRSLCSHAGAARFAYNFGLAIVKERLDAARPARTLSRRGRWRRAGPRIGFPRFKRRGRCRESFRYTTGRFGVSGRCRVQLPRIGHVRTHEPTASGGPATPAAMTRKGGRSRALGRSTVPGASSAPNGA